MTTLIATRGLPACGKTTWARDWVAQDPVRRARVNRDDFRRMCHDGTFIRGGTERSIIAARDATIAALLTKGLDVVCDDTNLPNRTVRDLRKIAVRARAEFEVHDLTDVPVEVCLERDEGRDGAVGRDIIVDLHQRFLKGKTSPLPVPEDPADPAESVAVYEPPSGAPSAILVDVDGTVAIMCGRSPFDETRVDEDTPNLPVIEAVRAMHAAGCDVVFMSARTAGCYDATESWLRKHVGIDFYGLHMRAEGDMRKDSVVKAELFDAHVRDRWDVRAVFDDRRQVVEMWRQMGLTVFHVAEGNF